MTMATNTTHNAEPGDKSTPTVIFSLPQGIGKSITAKQLAEYLGCIRIVDEWAPGQPIYAGALHLTNVDLSWRWRMTPKHTPMNHIMLDLETMALSPDAAILSIGAVRFDLDTSKIDTENGFYRPIFLESNIENKRRISQGTLEWWLRQSAQAQEVFTDLRRIDLDSALLLLANWIATTSDGTRDYVWSNGADFDLPILVHAYTSLGIEIPWPSYSGRCYRTYKKLPYADTVVLARDGTHHNALDDAIYQAQHLCAIHHKLFDGAAV